MQLSEHFSLDELCISEYALRTGVPNTPSAEQIKHLMRVATKLEEIRLLLGVPIHINSGYRSDQVNRAVGGAPTSAHLDGRAADIVPLGAKLRNCFDAIRTNIKGLDKAIIECNAWIHIQLPLDGIPPRGEYLVAWGGPGNWKYAPAA